MLEAIAERAKRMPELRESIHATGVGQQGVENRGILALVNQERLRRILARMLDEDEFLSPYGIRALSRYHLENPYIFEVHGEAYPKGAEAQALGRSQGGISTKIHLRTVGDKQLMTFVLTPGQRHEAIGFEALMVGDAVKRSGCGRPKRRPGRVVGDKAIAVATWGGICGVVASASPSLIRQMNIEVVLLIEPSIAYVSVWSD